MKVTVRLDDVDLKAGIENLRAKFPGAIYRALSRAATAGRTEITKAIVQDTALPSRRVRDEIKIVRVGDAAIQLEIAGKRLPLIDFRARGPEPSRGKGRGVSYRLPGGRGRAEHAFIATMKSGHRGVFQRREGQGRHPIVQLHGPSLVKVFAKFLPIGEARAREALLKNLRHEISFALKR